MPFTVTLQETQDLELSTESNYVNDYGVFYGHAGGGLVFILGGIIWMIRYSFSSTIHQQAIRKNDVIIMQIQKIPVEGVYWFFVGSLALVQIFNNRSFTVNIVTEEGEFIPSNLRGWQHVSLAAPFMFYGCIKIFAELRYPPCIPLADPVGIIACGIFSLVILLHTYSMEPVDVQIHYLLSATAFSATIAFVTDYTNPNSTIPFLVVRAFFMLLQGTWMVQAAFVLQPPNRNDDVTWDMHDEVNIMFVSTAYVWHFLFDMMFLVFLHYVVKISLRIIRKRPFVNYDAILDEDDD